MHIIFIYRKLNSQLYHLRFATKSEVYIYGKIQAEIDEYNYTFCIELAWNLHIVITFPMELLSTAWFR